MSTLTETAGALLAEAEQYDAQARAVLEWRRRKAAIDAQITAARDVGCMEQLAESGPTNPDRCGELVLQIRATAGRVRARLAAIRAGATTA